MDIKACGFIYPITSDHWRKSSHDKEKSFIQSKVKVLGTEINFYILFIIVPEDTYENYCTEFANNTDVFLKAIKSIAN